MWGLICKYWVFNFKCNVYENQSEPCILLNIYFIFFVFYRVSCSREGFSGHFRGAWRRAQQYSCLRDAPSVTPSTAPQSSDILQFCEFSHFYLQIYPFFLYSTMCFWFVLNSVELTRRRSWSPGRTDTWCLCGLPGLGSLTCWCSLGFCLVCFEEDVGSKLVFWNYFG